MKLIILSLVLISCGLTYSQEICNNAIDDDGDGLIDLLDDECQCGAGLDAQFINAIPNPNFDLSSCCPDSIWNNNTNLTCLDDWSASISNWNWGLQYLSSCDTCGLYNYWNTPQECYDIPFNGFLGITYWSNNTINWNNNNYASSCLNAPFTVNNTYAVSVDIYNSWWNSVTWNWSDTINLSLYGTTSCANLPMPSNTFCNINPNWILLDSISEVVPIDSAWHTYSFNFQPTSNITGIAIGPSCTNSNSGFNSYHRIFLDSLSTFYSYTYNIQILESGSYCTNDYILATSIDTVGGSWQWYRDSIALIGETNDTIDISNYGGGSFTALYVLNGQCQGAAISTTTPIYPFAFINATNSSCVDATVSFNGNAFITGGSSGNSITNYYWDFGDGGISYAEDTTYTYQTPGIYTVQFVAESNLGCTDTFTQDITINPKPQPSFAFSGQCIYDSVTFINTSQITTGSIDSIIWDFNDNTFGIDSVENHLYNAPGNYNVELLTVSSFGCMDSTTIPVFINPQPISSFNGFDTCVQSLINFSNNSSITIGNIISYNWNLGDNTVSTNYAPSHSYNIDSTYNVELIVTSDSGCVDTSNLNIIAHPTPDIDFNYTIACYSVDFNNLSSISNGTITSVNWDFGDLSTSTVSSPNHVFNSNGNYDITLIATSNFGCIDTLINPLNINTSFSASIETSSNLICHNDCITFYDSSTTMSGNANYKWVFSDGQTSNLKNPEICFKNLTADNIYIDVFFKISTQTGCIDSILISDYIEVIPIPQASFVFTPEKVSKNEPIAYFKNTSKQSDNYLWNFGDDNYSTEINPEHVYPEIGKTYTVSLTAYDDQKKCEHTVQNALIVADEILFYVPNVFTPDGNSFNDNFQPVFYSGVDPYHFKLEIFNRWGALIFVSENPKMGWDGLYNQALVASGTYVWSITFNETMSDKIHTKKGTVTVLR